MLQHGPICLEQNVESNLYNESRRNPKDVAIVRGVVQLAECQAIGNDGLALGMAVGKNVRRLQQLFMVETAYCALLLVRTKDTLSKSLLMDAALCLHSDVCSSRLEAYWIER